MRVECGELRVELKSVTNARELGGYKTVDGRTVKSGVLLRAGRLDNISDEDKNILESKYYVSDIIDFRMNMEIVKINVPDGAEYHHVNIIDDSELGEQADKGGLFEMSTEEFLQFIETAENLGIFGENMYITFLESAVGQNGYQKFLEILIKAKGAVLWHCTSGKDRTGLGAMLILSALGVDEETIIKDYLLTNEYNAERIAKTRKYFLQKTNDETVAEKAVLLMDGVSEIPMKKALAHLKEKYGSVMGYIKFLGISDKEIEILKEKYLI